jgi:hypothetical protein
VARLKKIERLDPPFIEVRRDYRRGSRWAEPRLVTKIADGNWGTDGRDAAPGSSLGPREDKEDGR